MLTYKTAEGSSVTPLEVCQRPGFSVKLYDPKFKEFIIYSVSVTSTAPENKLLLNRWSVMIALKGSVCLTRTNDKGQARVTQYSAWLLEPNEYSFAALEEPAELYIASEGISI